MSDAELVHKVMALLYGYCPDDATDDKVDAIFVFGRAQGEWKEGPGNKGVMKLAAWLWKLEVAPRIVIPGYAGTPDGQGGFISTGYPGWEVWQEELKRLNVPSSCIAKTKGEGTNTKTEGDDFVSLSRQDEFKSAVVVMYPHQMLRAMLGLVKSMEQMDYWMNVLPVCPTQVDWTDEVYGSQGERRLPRHLHIDEEWKRIPRYQQQGDLATFGDLEEYLRIILCC